jgi:hypothetical protein
MSSSAANKTRVANVVLHQAAKDGLMKAELVLHYLGGHTNLPADLSLACRYPASDYPKRDLIRLFDA